MKKILVVDDEIEILDLLEIFLTKKGFQVLKCNRGEKALKIIDKNESVDLIILDQKMPGLDGAGFLEQMRKKQKKISVILLTGSLNEEIKKLEVEALLIKPIDLNKLLDKINELLK